MQIKRSNAVTIILILVFLVSLIFSCNAQHTFYCEGVTKYVKQDKEWNADGYSKDYLAVFEVEEKRVLAYLEDGERYVYLITEVNYDEVSKTLNITTKDLGSDYSIYFFAFSVENKNVIVLNQHDNTLYDHRLVNIIHKKDD